MNQDPLVVEKYLMAGETELYASVWLNAAAEFTLAVSNLGFELSSNSIIFSNGILFLFNIKFVHITKMYSNF